MKTASDEADWTSSGRLFQSRGPAVDNERSPTVTSREGRTSRNVEAFTTEVDHSSADQRRCAAHQTNTEVCCRGEPGRQ